MKYVELMAKSNFSFLTGASHPEELVQTAVDQGLSGLALTDRNGLYGAGRGFRIAKDHKKFKYILGAELTFCDHPNLTVLAAHREGYARLCQLLTLAHQGKPKGEAFLRFDQLIRHGCRDDWILLPRAEENTQWPILKELFEHLYVPLTRYLDGHDHRRSDHAREVAARFDLPIVASNDVYYHTKQRKLLQDVLISVRQGKPLDQVGFDLFSNGERFLKTPQQMQVLFSDHPAALTNTVRIAEQCEFSMKELRYRYPSEWIPQGFGAQEYLEHLVRDHAPKIYGGDVPTDVARQLRNELKIIRQLEYADYFLTIFDIVQFARSKDILCQGRGSAANSAVCYVLGITAVDPVRMHLLFERFLSAERGEPPDIDVDFEHERREEVIQYIYQKYGRDRAAMVSAVVTYQWRSAFREVCKAFGLAVGTLSAKKVERDFDRLVHERAPEPAQKQQLQSRILSLTEELHGFPRHLSIHSGGFTLSADPIINLVPVEPARMVDRTIVQWDKYDLDELGLLKVDVLSLGMLSALRKTLNLIGKKLHEIPPEDRATYEMIQRCDTVGTFQIESRAQMSMLGRLQPKTFYDLVIEVAIVRPGPIVGKMVHPYLRRRQGLEAVHFPNKTVEHILGRTLGVPLFQEQVMALAIQLAGFTPGEADQLRRSINAWRSSAPIGEMATRLMNGLLQSGLPRVFAKQIFDQIQGFSMYGFPESHAASFALLAYASSYLKCHHPAAFAASLINSQPMGFYRNDTLIYDALRHQVRVLPVSVQKSQWDCTLEDKNSIRLGFRVVKGIAEADVQALLTERAELQFNDLTDFLKRTRLRRDVVYRLALAGRLSSRELDERQTLWAVLEYENLFSEPRHGQLSLFAARSDVQLADQSFAGLSAFDKIKKDYAAFSLSTHGHPMSAMRPQFPGLPKTTSAGLKQKMNGDKVKTAGLILLRQKPPTAKGTVFSTLEDEFGFTDLILHAEVYEKFREVFMYHCFVQVEGILQRQGFTVSVLVKKVQPLWAGRSMEQTPLAIEPTTYFY